MSHAAVVIWVTFCPYCLFCAWASQGGGAGPARQPDPADEGYGALGGPGAQNQGPSLRDLIKKAAPQGLTLADCFCLQSSAAVMWAFTAPAFCHRALCLHRRQ